MRLLRLPLLYLMAITLESCATDFPTVHPYVIDIPHAQCGAFVEVSTTPLKFEFKEWLPISQCQGFFAFPPSDVANVRAWYDSNKGSQK